MDPVGEPASLRASDPDAAASDRVERTLAAIAEAALGDAEAAFAWLTEAVALTEAPGEFVTRSEGFGGHELALLDFDPLAGERLRRLGAAIATPPAADRRVALAISGSAAQSRIQPFPADVDFFERVHFLTPTLAEAHRQLGEVVRECALRVDARPNIAGQDVRFGLRPGTSGDPGAKSPWLTWSFADVRAGIVRLTDPTLGRALEVTWAEAARQPGLVKLSWYAGDRSLGGPLWVSKVIDATWQAADGTIVSLDGQLDAEFQQVYLEPAGAALAADLIGAREGIGHLSDDRARYLRAMEREVVVHGRSIPPNYLKVAKRLYNVCRLTSRFAEAMFLRELFDEPVCRLYQSRVTIEAALRECLGEPPQAGDSVTRSEFVGLLDRVAVTLPADTACETAVECCREALRGPTGEQLRSAVAALDRVLIDVVNAELGGRYLDYPPIAELLRELHERYPDG
jgi:hypothetical protein